jgi:hypothetical protein
MKWTLRSAALAALLGIVWVSFATPAVADIKDYEFQLVKSEVNKGGAIVAVRLINKKTAQPVTGAVIFAKRIDMAPDNMETMDSPVQEVPSNEPSVYRFKTDLTIAGNWRLSLTAKIQGEEGTVESKLVLKVLP